MSIRIENMCIDCVDPQMVGQFWSNVLGQPLGGPEGNEWWIEREPGPHLLFLGVPEPKTIKNRMHLCLRPDNQAAEVDRLIELGATKVDIGQGDVTWVVMADPEGNEFCVLCEETSAAS